eukprot:15037783-Alexandrium_andersonii.AAC.1
MVPDPDTRCLRFPADVATVIVIDDSYSLTGDGRRRGYPAPRTARVTAATELIPEQLRAGHIPDKQP